jgi:hypothetical protein
LKYAQGNNWDKMEKAKTHRQLKKAHRAWCRKIGLDVYGGKR